MMNNSSQNAIYNFMYYIIWKKLEKLKYTHMYKKISEYTSEYKNILKYRYAIKNYK